jgi:lycopene beta-cyclase|tara:strand:- start:1278 stop:2414 length:1137 start_codon:yes stop_codon:yes gene_type:complete
MRKIECDVLIIGGGCAGLSLAYEYAQMKKAGLSVCILEKRKNYHDDRTWCFWLDHQQEFSHRDIILNSWKAWRFSSREQSHTHRSEHFSYCHIASLAFYKKTTEAINEDPRQTLVLEQVVSKIEKNGKSFNVEGPNLSARATHVIDTRAYEPNELIQYTQIFQSFSGVEIETEDDLFDSELVGLMDDIQGNGKICQFRYLLPFTKRRALIEFTSFSNAYHPPSDLNASLQCYLDSLEVSYKVIRKEQGVLPMGINHPPRSEDGIILGGMKNDNLKPSSGYGFLRTQIWAKLIVTKFCNDTLDIKVRKAGHYIPDFFDHTFLRVLDNNIDLAEDIFMSIGKNMNPDSFAKFMSDKAQVHDFMRLIAAVPKQPFIKAVLL